MTDQVRCLHCGGPMTFDADLEESRLTILTRVVDGTIVEEEQTEGWCSTCIHEWNARVSP